MREQNQEQERREAEQRQLLERGRAQVTSTAALNVPLNIQSIGVDVPPQVLQVRPAHPFPLFGDGHGRRQDYFQGGRGPPGKYTRRENKPLDR